ncbi:riboflavin synthase alpha chain [Fontibacillus phaseoli]|uniref:Riboflavin synthase n=1 Tax=Fontibacillus phaseoli TaxID=1416533 RepID=A0A369BRJ1_9BACL|nr:riboflavin synthase [Fontibacillus phaseoli]RCX23206.1 riboflavin synthase alpha chain [Fontibacillus phaseoli]
MFTGLVEEIGTMKSVGRQGEAMLLGISARVVTDGIKLGDSIAVNGVCLTVISFDKSSFTVDVMPQTYRHTNLLNLKQGSRVNLERAMAAGGRFGGHIVQGHVDGIGTILHTSHDQNAVVYEIEPAKPSMLKYIIPQGSITLDGISLTVVKVVEGRFSVSIIPHTLAETVLAFKRPGDTVNIECDVLGKYVEHLLNYGSARNGMQSDRVGNESSLDLEFLSKHGFA